ncbi:MAG TPA: inorganic phosphate transporter [Candidatus Bilamarchaeum sp.]|nr:inorganic phosphate transporter [Candidatus Bilamarchaeum sp.]
MTLEILFIAAVAAVLWWTFWSGFSDASNAITTVVATRVLKPWQAVALAACGNMVGMFLGEAVATTVGKGVVDTSIVSGTLVICAIMGGMLWEYITYRRGIPISETQVLVGTVAGAGIAAGGLEVVKFDSMIGKILLPMAVAPIVAFLVVLLFVAVILRVARRVPASASNRAFKSLQVLSSAFFSVAHGANDGQKSTGILLAIFIFYGFGTGAETVPLWLKVLTFLALSLGTLFGGWRIVQKMGFKLARIKPWQGFAAETSAALVVAGASAIGFPLSTSQTVAGSIMGVSAAKGGHAINMGVAREILFGWILTIPVSMALGFVTYSLVDWIF